jgi:hypothetical protein
MSSPPLGRNPADDDKGEAQRPDDPTAGRVPAAGGRFPKAWLTWVALRGPELPGQVKRDCALTPSTNAPSGLLDTDATGSAPRPRSCQLQIVCPG